MNFWSCTVLLLFLFLLLVLISVVWFLVPGPCQSPDSHASMVNVGILVCNQFLFVVVAVDVAAAFY